MIISTIIFALLYSLFFFTAVMHTVGPEGNRKLKRNHGFIFVPLWMSQLRGSIIFSISEYGSLKFIGYICRKRQKKAEGEDKA